MIETIGILPAGNLGRLSQMFCVQKMKDAGISKTLVYTRFYSSGVGSDYRVASEKQLAEKLKELPRDAVAIVSSNSKMYKSMATEEVPSYGYAIVYYGASRSVEGVSKDLAVKALNGSASIVAAVGAMLDVLSGVPVSTDIPHGSSAGVWRSAVRPARQTRWLRDVEYEMEDGIPAVLPVVFLTHNRTAVARCCLDALCKNLKYSGRIHFCICDDRSEQGHVEALEIPSRGRLLTGGVLARR